MLSKRRAYIKTVVTTIVCATVSFISVENVSANTTLEQKSVVEINLNPTIDYGEAISVESTNVSRGNTVNQLIGNAYNYVGTPYVYGANGPTSFDCSGFTKYVFASMGIDIPRTSQAQYNSGIKVSTEDLQSGDLVFFNTYTTLGHVGIYIGNGEFIHASCSKGVTVSSLNNSYYSSKYAGAVRY